MPDYIAPGIETDPDVIAQLAFDRLGALIPGWEPSETDLVTILLETVSRMAAENRDLASEVPTAIFRYYGATVIDLPPVDEQEATGESTWTMIDNAGYTIEAGTVVNIPAAGDELLAFETDIDVVIPPGQTSTAAGEVTLTALVAGEEANGLTGTPELQDALDFVATITLTQPTSGGVDAEADSDYLNRLAERLKLLSPRPIIEEDFAILARDIPGVWRATAVDGYNPDNATFNNERMVAVASIDEAGNAVGSTIEAEVDAYLQALREANFIVNTFDPTYTAIGVTFAGVAVKGADPEDVETRAEAAVAEYLSPANWGKVSRATATEDEADRTWVNQTQVRQFEVVALLNNIQGMDYLTSVTLSGGTASGSDRILAGVAALPTAGAISGSVSAP
jgi:hypothetical protein